MEPTETKPDPTLDTPERDGGVALEMAACLVAAIILTGAAYALARLVLSWIG